MAVILLGFEVGGKIWANQRKKTVDRGLAARERIVNLSDEDLLATAKAGDSLALAELAWRQFQDAPATLDNVNTTGRQLVAAYQAARKEAKGPLGWNWPILSEIASHLNVWRACVMDYTSKGKARGRPTDFIYWTDSAFRAEVDGICVQQHHPRDLESVLGHGRNPLKEDDQSQGCLEDEEDDWDDGGMNDDEWDDDDDADGDDYEDDDDLDIERFTPKYAAGTLFPLACPSITPWQASFPRQCSLPAFLSGVPTPKRF